MYETIKMVTNVISIHWNVYVNISIIFVEICTFYVICLLYRELKASAGTKSYLARV